MIFFCKDCEKCFNDDDKYEDNKHKEHEKLDLYKCQDGVSNFEGVDNCDDHIQNNHPTAFMEMKKI